MRTSVSDVHTRATDVFTMASFGPGSGTGFSIIPTSPMRVMTKALMVVELFEVIGLACMADEVICLSFVVFVFPDGIAE